MTQNQSFTINAGWRILLEDVGLSPDNVLRRAGLPADLFVRQGSRLSTAEYFRLWKALEDESGDPLLPLNLGTSISAEAFDPPIFAALCSPDLATAVRRIARYKRLICPMAIHWKESFSGSKAAWVLDLEWLDASVNPPPLLSATELVFFTQLARLATRHEIQPLRVSTPKPPSPAEDYTRYFGVPVVAAPHHRLVFDASDARRPFLTANEAMWEFFEPELRRRLSELDASASLGERVRAALLELLPSGGGSVGEVASRLGLSRRTLQRRLSAEGETFQNLLADTRRNLAIHYLRSSSLSGAEISFLLGYEEPSSFFRAFQTWTGTTPEQVRMQDAGATAH